MSGWSTMSRPTVNGGGMMAPEAISGARFDGMPNAPRVNWSEYVMWLLLSGMSTCRKPCANDRRVGVASADTNGDSAQVLLFMWKSRTRWPLAARLVGVLV